MTGEGQQQAFQAALAANQQQYQDVLSGRQSYLAGDIDPALQQASMALQAQEAQEQGNIANAQMANQYNLGSAGMQNQYNLAAGEYPNQFNLNNYQNQLQSYQEQQQGLFGGILGGGMLAKAGLQAGQSLFGGGGSSSGSTTPLSGDYSDFSNGANWLGSNINGYSDLMGGW